jgi:hypothetical protein
MPRKEACIPDLSEHIRHVLVQILGNEPALEIVIERRLRINFLKKKNKANRKQKKQIKNSSRWWANNSQPHELPIGWKAEVVDLITPSKNSRGGGG